MSFVHRVKEWWDRHPLRILIGFAVAILTAFALVWGLFSSDPPIPEIVNALRARDAMPSFAQFVGLALLLLALGLLTALLVAVLLKHRAEDSRLREDLSVVVMALRAIVEPNDLQIEWQRREARLREERADEEELRGQLRQAAGLRPLRKSEIGRKVSDLPRGIYCFVETLGIAEFPHVPQMKWRFISEDDLSFAAKLGHAVTQEPLRFFKDLLEVHLETEGKTFIVGFAQELDATDLESGQSRRTRLYLSRAEHASVPVRVKVDRIEGAIQYPTKPPHIDLTLTAPAGPPPTTA